MRDSVVAASVTLSVTTSTRCLTCSLAVSTTFMGSPRVALGVRLPAVSRPKRRKVRSDHGSNTAILFVAAATGFTSGQALMYARRGDSAAVHAGGDTEGAAEPNDAVAVDATATACHTG